MHQTVSKELYHITSDLIITNYGVSEIELLFILNCESTFKAFPTIILISLPSHQAFICLCWHSDETLTSHHVNPGKEQSERSTSHESSTPQQRYFSESGRTIKNA